MQRAKAERIAAKFNGIIPPNSDNSYGVIGSREFPENSKVAQYYKGEFAGIAAY